MAEYRGKKGKKQNSESSEAVIVEAILRGIWTIISFPFRGKASRGPRIAPAIASQLASHWPDIETHLHAQQTLALAVSDADKLLDAAMQAASIPGKNMGERLMQAKNIFGKDLYQRIWDAHKLRNTLAHEMGTQVSSVEASFAVSTFRSALRELGVPV